MTLKVSAVQRIRDTPRQRGLVSSCGNFRRGGEWMRRGVNRLRWSPTQPAGLLPGDAPTQQQERMLGRLAALPACHLQVAKIALSLSHCSASLPFPLILCISKAATFKLTAWASSLAFFFLSLPPLACSFFAHIYFILLSFH